MLAKVRAPSGAASAARPFAGLAQQFGNGGLHVFGADAVEGNTEFYLQEGIGGAGTRHYFQGNRRFEGGTRAA